MNHYLTKNYDLIKDFVLMDIVNTCIKNYISIILKKRLISVIEKNKNNVYEVLYKIDTTPLYIRTYISANANNINDELYLVGEIELGKKDFESDEEFITAFTEAFENYLKNYTIRMDLEFDLDSASPCYLEDFDSIVKAYSYVRYTINKTTYNTPNKFIEHILNKHSDYFDNTSQELEKYRQENL